MRQTKLEYYPDGFDETGLPKGPRTMVFQFFIAHNGRYKKLTGEEKSELWELIETFKGRLGDVQKELLPNT